jgi:hypothetical protein
MSGAPFRLLDETASPPVRQVIGELMAAADRVDFALARIRLANLDLSEDEVAPERCRVLLGHVDASTLLDTDAADRMAVEGLIRWAGSGRLEVRSAGIGAWTPDFSLYHTADGGTCLLGAHYFGAPYLTVGPSFTAVSTDPDARAVLGRRFDELWGRSHDVLPAIVAVLERARGVAPAP